VRAAEMVRRPGLDAEAYIFTRPTLSPPDGLL